MFVCLILVSRGMNEPIGTFQSPDDRLEEVEQQTGDRPFFSPSHLALRSHVSHFALDVSCFALG